MSNDEFDLLVTRYVDKEMDLPAERRLFEILEQDPVLEDEFKGQVAMHNLLCLYYAEEKGFPTPELAPLPIWMDEHDPENPPLPQFPVEKELTSDWYTVLTEKKEMSDWYSVLADVDPGTAILN